MTALKTQGRKKRHRILVNSRKKKCYICHTDTKLQFHHIDPSTKTRSVSEMVNYNCSTGALKKEIAKCVVLCHRCHCWVHKIIN